MRMEALRWKSDFLFIIHEFFRYSNVEIKCPSIIMKIDLASVLLDCVRRLNGSIYGTKFNFGCLARKTATPINIVTIEEKSIRFCTTMSYHVDQSMKADAKHSITEESPEVGLLSHRQENATT
jgi:hypothetical protein